MRFRSFLGLAFLLTAPISLWAQNQVPLGLNLPTTNYLAQGLAIRFTHRFVDPFSSGSRNLYGLDGLAYSGFGLDGPMPGLPELNYQIYRSSDQKVLTLAMQGILLQKGNYRSSFRLERFDEMIDDVSSTSGVREGLVGLTLQVPTEFYFNAWTLNLVPTWISQSSTTRSIFNIGLGLRYTQSPKHSFLMEFYPVPSRTSNLRISSGSSATRSPRAAYAIGYEFQTFGHRFTIVGSNSSGTTAHQVLTGDYRGIGAQSLNDWGLGFNIIRIF